MSETPRTDAQEAVYPLLLDPRPVDVAFARQLETDLAAATRQRDELKEAVGKRDDIITQILDSAAAKEWKRLAEARHLVSGAWNNYRPRAGQRKEGMR